jgi:Flp pilus assembly protein TadG
MLLPIIAIVGLGVDGARLLLARYEFRAALDSAALSAGTTYATEEELTEIANAYVDRNFRVWGARVLSVQAVPNEENVVVNGTFELDTLFYAALGRKHVVSGASTEIRRAGGGLMVAMVLDYTGSMWTNNNIGGLRNSTISLSQHLFGDDENPDDLRVALVPWTASVNVGSIAPSLIDPATVIEYDPTDKTKWMGCIEERPGSLSLSYDPPGPGKYWKPYIYPIGPDNNYDPANPATILPGGGSNSNGFTGPNLGCPANPIVPLTNSRATILSHAHAITAWNRGGTLADIGMMWGLRVMNPGVPFTESTEIDPANGLTLHESPRWRKAIVMMTDGDNLFFKLGNNVGPNKPTNPTNSSHVNYVQNAYSDYGGYGRLGQDLANTIVNTSNAGTARTRINNRFVDLCQRAKDEGYVVYTVVFTSGVTQATRNLYRDCASDPGKYWYAPDSTALNNSFQQIANDLSKLRIVR